MPIYEALHGHRKSQKSKIKSRWVCPICKMSLDHMLWLTSCRNIILFFYRPKFMYTWHSWFSTWSWYVTMYTPDLVGTILPNWQETAQFGLSCSEPVRQVTQSPAPYKGLGRLTKTQSIDLLTNTIYFFMYCFFIVLSLSFLFAMP
jgi:hypothetical protein